MLHPFRQRRYFYYFSGVDEPDCYLTYDIGKDLLILYVPDFDLGQAIWLGSTITVEEAQARYGRIIMSFFLIFMDPGGGWYRQKKKAEKGRN